MTDRDFMLRAIELAERGRGFTNPNPVVGAVVVKDGRIIGEGYHEKYGQLHAERNALASLTEPARGATIYVTLEPCCHYGKTPPCTEAIIEHGLARVVIGSRDPNPKVAGKGARILRDHGIDVTEDFMMEECDRLNPVFFHYITTGLPYVVCKYAMTADGKIATREGLSKWITGEKAREHVHRLRHNLSSIMVGIETVLKDDPMLNTRLDGLTSPVRVICDSRLRLPLESNICQTAGELATIDVCAFAREDEDYLTRKSNLEKRGVEVINLPGDDGRVDLEKLMCILGERKLDSVLLEGGGALNESAFRAGIVNEVLVYVAPKIFGGSDSPGPVRGFGVSTPQDAYALELKDIRKFGEDILLDYLVRKGD